MSDRWDVVVSGVADRTPHGLWRVATEVSRASGFDPNVVFAAISQGPVIVAAQMGAAEATALEGPLSSSGATVELRPAGTSGSIPVLGAGVTGVGHVPHAPGPVGPSPGSELYSALAHATEGLDAAGLSSLDGSAIDEQRGAGPPSSGTGSEMDARFGSDISAESGGASAPPPPQADHQEVETAPLAGDGELELDLDAAGMEKKKRSAIPEVEPKPVEVPERIVASPAPEPVVRLLGSDPVAVGLLAAAIGLAAGLVPASRAASRIERDQIEPTIEELDVSIQRPLAVRAGKLESPDQLAGAIDDMSSSARTRFLLTWIGFAIPIGLVLGFLKRPGG